MALAAALEHSTLEPNQTEGQALFLFATGRANALIGFSRSDAANFDFSWQSALESIRAEDGHLEEVEPYMPAVSEAAAISDAGWPSVLQPCTIVGKEAANSPLTKPSPAPVPDLPLKSAGIRQPLHGGASLSIKAKVPADAGQSDRCSGEHDSKDVGGHQPQLESLDPLISLFPMDLNIAVSPSHTDPAPSPAIERRADSLSSELSNGTEKRIVLLQSPILSTAEIVSASAGTGKPQNAISVEDRSQASASFSSAQGLAQQPDTTAATNPEPLFNVRAVSLRSRAPGSTQDMHCSSASASSNSQPIKSKQQIEDTRESSGSGMNSAVTGSRSAAENTGRAAGGRDSGQDVSSLRHPAIHPEMAEMQAASPAHHISAIQLETGAGPVTPATANLLLSTAGVEHRTGPGQSAGLSLDQTLAALDAANEPVSQHWIQAGARRAEAGFEDPVLGWIGVRAQLDSTGVHAALVPSSGAAAESLGAHLAGLNAYLAEHHAPVDSLKLEAPALRTPEQGTQMGLAQGHGNDAGNGHGSGAQTTLDQRTNTDSTNSSDGAAVTVTPTVPQVFISPESRYISVVA